MIHYIEQGTPEWHALRKNKMTASHACEIGNAGKGLESYCYEIIAEKYASSTESYTNEHLERGVELEGQARAIYELQTGQTVEQIGFYEHDEYVGCSPDGIVGEGLIEIKCHNNVKHVQLICGSPIEPKYIWQMQMQMLLMEKKWCDYVAYNPNYEKSLHIVRVLPDPDMQEKIKVGLEKGKVLLQEIEAKFMS